MNRTTRVVFAGALSLSLRTRIGTSNRRCDVPFLHAGGHNAKEVGGPRALVVQARALNCEQVVGAGVTDGQQVEASLATTGEA